jgi:hypothetical protein
MKLYYTIRRSVAAIRSLWFLGDTAGTQNGCPLCLQTPRLPIKEFRPPGAGGRAHLASSLQEGRKGALDRRGYKRLLIV